MNIIRVGLLIVTAAMVSGCLFSFNPHAQEVQQLQQQADALTARVGQLEQEAGLSSGQVGGQVVIAQGAAAVPANLAAQETAVSSARAAPSPSGGFRFPWTALQVKKALSKLLRGVTNVLTGWVEIPKRVHETTEASGAGAGFTYGVLRGVGYGFVRTAAGAYEVITFPVPAPPDFRPVMHPAYVFLCDNASPSSQP